MNRFLAFVLGVLALVAATESMAQMPATPEETQKAYVEAMRTKGMVGVVEYIHPDELKRFQGMLLPVLVEDTPTAKKFREALFGASATPESVKALSPDAFLGAIMVLAQKQMEGTQLAIGESQILGSVKEGDIVHLLTRQTVGAGPMQLTQLEVVSMKPYQGGWRVLLSGTIEGLGQAISAAAGAPQ